MANMLSTGTGFAGLWGPNAILTASGSPVVNTPVTVYQSDGSTMATLYTSQTRGTTLANPVSTDSFGNLSFYANPGIYILSFNVGGVVTTDTIQVSPWYADGADNIVNDTATSGGSTFSVAAGDFRVANATAGNITYNLPGVGAGLRFSVVRVDTSSYTVTITTPSGTIVLPDGTNSASVTVGSLATVSLIADGTAWRPCGTTTQLPLSSLAQSSATSGQVPEWNGSAWVPSSLTGAPGTTVQSYITANITNPSSGLLNITSVSLAAGTWLVTARAFVAIPTNSNNDLILGPNSASLTGAYAALSFSNANGGGTVSLTESITVASTTTVYLMIDSSAGYTVYATSLTAAIGNQSGITAVQTA